MRVLGSPSRRDPRPGAGGKGHRREGGHLPLEPSHLLPTFPVWGWIWARGPRCPRISHFPSNIFSTRRTFQSPVPRLRGSGAGEVLSTVCAGPVEGGRWAGGEEPALGTIAAPWAAGRRTPRLWCGQPVSSRERPGPDSPRITRAVPGCACRGLEVSCGARRRPALLGIWSESRPDTGFHFLICSPSPSTFAHVPSLGHAALDANPCSPQASGAA